MGEVYKARDTRLDRIVAIKILPELLAADPQFRERFDREARTISQLDHQHICPLYDVGAQDGMAFLVMQCLEGETLAARLARSRIALPDAITIGTQIAEALDCAHRAGIVHRDLKPGNIFLTTTGAGSTASAQAKLLDFGLAKIGVAAGGDSALTRMRSPDLTMAGTMIGTVQYMAPEQIEGRKTDARTDMFAFGLVLFEMIAGRKAFEADTQGSLMVAVLSQEPRHLSSLAPDAPAWLEQLVGRCLAKNPDERWPSMAAIRHELQVRSSSSSDSGALAPRGETPAGSSRRPVWIGAALVAAALAAAILIVGWRRAAPLAPLGAPKASLAVLPLRSIEEPGGDTTHIGVGIADAILTRLANVRSIRVRPTSAIVAFEGGSIDPVAAGRRLQVDHVLAGTIRRVEDSYRFTLQLVRTSDGVLVWGRQIDISRRSLFGIEDQVSAEVAGALQLELSSGERARLSQRYTQNPDAYAEYLQGRALLANYSDSNMRQAIEHFERALHIDPDYVLAVAGMATAAGISSVRFAYDLRQATEWGRRAEDYARKALRQDASLGEVHLALASAAGTLYRNFDWPTVIQEADAALAQNPNLDLAHSALARAFYHLGQLDWSDLESARAEETSGGSNNVEVSRVHLYNKFLSGGFDEARRMSEALLTRTDVAVVHQYLGLASFYGGDHAKGEQVLRAVRRPDGSADPRSLASLAGILAANGQRDEAARTVGAVLDSGYMDHHVAFAVGVASSQLGRPAEGVKWLRTAAETGFPCYPWIVRDPLLDPIRSDPGFQAFVTELRADYDRARTRYQSASRTP